MCGVLSYDCSYPQEAEKPMVPSALRGKPVLALA